MILRPMEALWIAAAFTLGLGFRQLGLPPLVGFLAAGFGLQAAGYSAGPALEHIAHIGVLLLLFSVGLKVRLRSILQPAVYGTAIAHLLLWTAVIGPALALAVGLGWWPGILVGLALGFSSTVVAAKGLEDKRELRAFHGRVAIGVLVLQDLVAVALLAFAGGAQPSPWALVLLLMPLLALPLSRLLEFTGHGELLALLGLLLAIAVGGKGFESVGLSSELGALLLGALLAPHARAKDLAESLWSLKEVFLVGFFLQIGMAGLPDLQALGIACALLLVLPIKAALFFLLLVRFGLRARSSFLCAIALGSYSEFALIVAQVATKNGLLAGHWLVTLALTVSLSFALAAPLHGLAHRLYARFEARLCRMESSRRHPDDEPVSLGSACVMIMGMGRVGSGAYDHLTAAGYRVVGLDSDPAKLERHRADGRRVLYADAEDPGFWTNLDLEGVTLILLTVPELEAREMSCRKVRGAGYRGHISSIAMFDRELEPLRQAGADATFSFYELAGPALAAQALATLTPAEQEIKTAVD